MEMSFREFRKACSSYGYQGDAQSLFDSLDSDRQGYISLSEISFIDEWEANSIAHVPTAQETREAAARAKDKQVKKEKEKQTLCSPRLNKLAQPKSVRALHVEEVCDAGEGPVAPAAKSAPCVPPSPYLPPWDS